MGERDGHLSPFSFQGVTWTSQNTFFTTYRLNAKSLEVYWLIKLAEQRCS